jgi:AAA+ ATPase superfamily predicted ATPase
MLLLELEIAFCLFTTPKQDINMHKFIGRKAELDQLNRIMQLRKSSFIIVKGRRRIGKSRLIKEFGKNFDHYYSFAGLAPNDNTTIQHQLDEFSNQFSRTFNAPPAKYDDWSNVFWALSERVKKGKILLLFDEISWMGSKDPTFLAKIKNLWDLYLSQNP